MNEMEASCSFKFIVGSACSYDRQDRSKLFEVVPLVSCNKDVQGHKSAWCFAGVKNESELNLARAGIFYMSAKDINALTICPFHRSELGTGWRRSQNSQKKKLLCNICALCIQILVLFKKCNFSVNINNWLGES